MDDREFYRLLEEFNGEEEPKKENDIKEIVKCLYCHNDIKKDMIFCPFCGEKILNIKQEKISHTHLIQAIKQKKYKPIWEQINNGNLDAQKIMNDYIIDIICNARQKRVVSGTFELLEPYRANSLFVQGLWERAVIEVNRDRGVLDMCEIHRDPILMNKAIKNEFDIAQKGDTLSLFTVGIYLLYGRYGIKKDEEKAYRYLFQSAKQGYYVAKTILTINILEKKCDSNYGVGDITDNLLIGAFFGNEKAKEFLNNGLFLNPSAKWEKTSILDVWGRENIRYIRKFQEYREMFLEMIPKYNTIIESVNEKNKTLVLEFLDEKERESLDEKRKLAERERERLEEKQKLEVIAMTELNGKSHLDVSEIYIGDLFYNGKYVKRDYAKAFEYYMYAYNQGSAGAAYMIGTMYRDGFGVNKNSDKMIEWYKKSVDMNCDYAKFELANSYIVGISEKVDYGEVLRLYESLAENGHVESQSILGTIFLTGEYGKLKAKVDYDKAIKWLKLASDQKEPLAECLLATCYYYGYGVGKDHVAAKWLCKESIEQGFLQASQVMKELFGIDYVSCRVQDKVKLMCKQLTESNPDTFKITNALIQYLGIPDNESIFIAHDDTLFGNGKLGFAITENGIYLKSSGWKSHVSRIPFKQINSVKLPKLLKHIIVNDNLEIPLDCCSKKEVNEVFKILEGTKMALEEEQKPKEQKEGEVELRRKREEKLMQNISRLDHEKKKKLNEIENPERRCAKNDSVGNIFLEAAKQTRKG